MKRQPNIFVVALSGPLLAIMLVLTGLTPVRAEPKQQRPLVLAYYYPWYVKGNWSRHKYVGTPKLGEYGTNNSVVAEQHIRWARAGGVDAFVVSWWGPDHLAAAHTKEGLLKASNLKSIRFTLIYESLGRLDHLDGTKDSVIDFAQPKVAQQFADDVKHLNKQYFQHTSYLRTGDKPVLVLYVTRTFRNFESRHITQAEKAAGVDLFLIADDPFFGNQNDPKTARHGLRGGRPVFDAYTAYNMFENARVREGETATAYIKREAEPIFQRWARATVFYPNVMPSYHDFRGHKLLAGGVEGFRKQLESALMIKNPRSTNAPRMIFITSFNEWWEGTTIEPAAEYGSSYLETVRKTLGPVK